MAGAHRVSAPALHAARTLMKHFELVPKRGGRIRNTENNIAILIDVCTQSFRMQNALDALCANVPRFDRTQSLQQMAILKEMVATIDLVRNKAPRYGEEAEVPLWQTEAVEAELTRGQMQEMQLVSKALAGARSVNEEQQILRQAGIRR